MKEIIKSKSDKDSVVILNNINFKKHMHPGMIEKGGGISETLPDQAMTMRQIMKRYAMGINTGTVGEEITNIDQEDYDTDEADILSVNPRSLDLADRQLWAEAARQEIEEIKEKLKPKPKEPSKAPEI